MSQKLTINLPDELAARLTAESPPLDVDGICAGALQRALDGGKGVHTEEEPKEVRRGRPPGRTREKRTINLEPRLWTWLESKARPNETFNDTCNRVLSDAQKLLP